MTFKEYSINKLKEKSSTRLQKILFVDGTDTRAIEAVTKHEEDKFLKAILLFKKASDVPANATSFIVMEDWKSKENVLIQKYLERRKGKETEEQAKIAIQERATFAMLMVELGEVDGIVGGLEDPTSVILRAAFKVIGPAKGVKTISSIMIMEKGDDWSIFTDISVNIAPTKEQLVDIAFNASKFAESIDFEVKPAFLSFSTSGSASHPHSLLVKDATDLFNETTPYKAIGEVQFDAAVSTSVRDQKYKGDSFDGKPTILVFPSLNAGNIGYKIAQRLGGYGAIGPILTGVNKPVNDLSRGATIEDVYNTALLTALQSCK